MHQFCAWFKKNKQMSDSYPVCRHSLGLVTRLDSFTKPDLEAPSVFKLEL